MRGINSFNKNIKVMDVVLSSFKTRFYSGLLLFRQDSGGYSLMSSLHIFGQKFSVIPFTVLIIWIFYLNLQWSFQP